MISESSESRPSGRHTLRELRTRRYEPTALYALANTLKREGLDLHNLAGPWRPIRRELRRPGRNAERTLPIVTNGTVEIAVDMLVAHRIALPPLPCRRHYTLKMVGEP